MYELREGLGDNPVAFKPLSLHLKSSHRILKTGPQCRFHTSNTISPRESCDPGFPVLRLLNLGNIRSLVGGRVRFHRKRSIVPWRNANRKVRFSLAPSRPREQLSEWEFECQSNPFETRPAWQAHPTTLQPGDFRLPDKLALAADPLRQLFLRPAKLKPSLANGLA